MDPDLEARSIEAAPDAIITVDLSGRITSWNLAAQRLLGHGDVEAVGQTLALIVPNALRARHIEGFRAAMSSGQLHHGGRPAVIEATHKDGRTIVASMTLAVLVDATKEPQGAVAVLRPTDPEPISFIKSERTS